MRAFRYERAVDTWDAVGIKGIGEIGITGTAAAIGNAVYHAIGLPVKEEK